MLSDRSVELLRRWVPVVLLAALCAYYFGVMEQLVWLRHRNYGTFDYDLGMYDQGIWQLAHGRQFMTVRGMKVLGHHANVGFVLLAPFYWFGAGPQFLNALNTFAITIAAVPVFAFVRHHFRSAWSSWAALAISAAYLFHFIPQWVIQETFHPENLAVPFLLGAFYFASIRRWRPYWACVALALVWKEDVALFVLMMGVVIAVSYRAWKVGLWTMAAGAAWFLVATQVIIRAFSPAGAVFDSLFGPLGTSATDVALNSLRHPTMVGRALGEHQAEAGAMRIIRPFGYVAFGAPLALLMGLPQHVINFLSVQNFTWNPQTHYFILPMTSAVIATARAVVTRTRQWMGWLLVGACCIGVIATAEQGVGPWTTNASRGYWPTVTTSKTRAIDRLIDRIPEDAAVSANYMFVPHLSHRKLIFTFPNPWISSNYGPGSRPLHEDPSVITWMLIDRALLNDTDRTQFELVATSGEFKVVEEVGDLVLLRRVAA